MKIIKADESYLQAINNIDNLAFKHPWSIEQLRTSLSSPIAVYLLAVEDNLPVGYIGFYTTGDILNIAVAPNKRHCGIAKLLIQSAESEAKSRGMDSLILEVNEGNTAAVNLYTNMDFKYINKRLNYYHGTDNALIYIKHLV